ncbi:MAG: hypothetical protein WCI47_01030 [bacterium]
MTDTGPQDFDLSQMTAEEVVAEFADALTSTECVEIVEFELDGPDTLGMIVAALNDRNVPLKRIDELMARFDPIDSITQPH